MKANIEIVPFDGIWGSFAKLLDQGKITLPDHPLSALDLGCGAGYSLYVLFHDFGFTSLTGVDHLTEAGALAQEKRHLPAENRTANQEVLWHCNSIYELYRLIIQPDLSKLHKASLQPLEFYQHFDLVWERDMVEYLDEVDPDSISSSDPDPSSDANSNDRFDLIIMSNVLHFQPYQGAKALVQKGVKRLKQGGVLLVRVYHEGSEKFRGTDFVKGAPSSNNSIQGSYQVEYQKDGESYWAYNKDLFLNLFEGMEVLAFEGVRNTHIPGYKFLTAAVVIDQH